MSTFRFFFLLLCLVYGPLILLSSFTTDQFREDPLLRLISYSEQDGTEPDNRFLLTPDQSHPGHPALYYVQALPHPLVTVNHFRQSQPHQNIQNFSHFQPQQNQHDLPHLQPHQNTQTFPHYPYYYAQSLNMQANPLPAQNFQANVPSRKRKVTPPAPQKPKQSAFTPVQKLEKEKKTATSAQVSLPKTLSANSLPHSAPHPQSQRSNPLAKQSASPTNPNLQKENKTATFAQASVPKKTLPVSHLPRPSPSSVPQSQCSNPVSDSKKDFSSSKEENNGKKSQRLWEAAKVSKRDKPKKMRYRIPGTLTTYTFLSWVKGPRTKPTEYLCRGCLKCGKETRLMVQFGRSSYYERFLSDPCQLNHICTPDKIKEWKEEAERARKRAALYEFAEKVKKSSVGKRGKRKIEAEESMLEESNLDEKSKQKVRTIIEKERERDRKKREKRKKEKKELEDEVRRWRLQLSLFELVDNIECEERMKKKAKFEYDENTELTPTELLDVLTEHALEDCRCTYVE